MERRAQASVPARGPRPSCLVCADPLPRGIVPAANGEPVCASPLCRQIARRRAGLEAAAFAQLVEIHRRHVRDQRERAAAAARQLAERRAIEERENSGLRNVLGLDESLPEALYPLVPLPTGPHRLEPLPEHRRAAYRAHLEAIVAEAVSKPDGGEADPSVPAGNADEVPLAAQLCTLCGGGCCPQGAERAYLRPETMRRMLRLNPQWQAGQLVDLYLARLAPETVAGSCVNQTATGCSLPREMRSDLCNHYFCPSVRQWQKRCAEGTAPHGALVVQRGFNHWRQASSGEPNHVTGVYVVTATDTQPLPWPATAPD